MAEKKKKIAPNKASLKRLWTWLRPGISRFQLWIFLIILSATISLLLFRNILIISKQAYSLGDVANKDIKASHDFDVEDKELTKQRRDEAVRSSLFVYDFDRSGAYVNQRIKEAFTYGRTELKRILSIELEPTLRSEKLGELRDKVFELLGITGDPGLFYGLVKAGFSSQIENNAQIAVNRILEKGIVENKTVLMTQKGRGIILLDTDTQKGLTVDDLDRFYDLEGARHHIGQIIDQNATDEDGPQIVATTGRLAKLLIRPNITFNKRETELRKEEAKESVKPIYFKVKKGEMIVREGEKINPTHLSKLTLETEAKPQRNPPIPFMALSMTVMIGILLALSYVVFLRRSSTFKGDASPSLCIADFSGCYVSFRLSGIGCGDRLFLGHLYSDLHCSGREGRVFRLFPPRLRSGLLWGKKLQGKNGIDKNGNEGRPLKCCYGLVDPDPIPGPLWNSLLSSRCHLPHCEFSGGRPGWCYCRRFLTAHRNGLWFYNGYQTP